MTRVLFVANSAAYFRSHRLNLARALRAKGFDVGVVVPAGSDDHNAEIERAGVAVYTYPYAAARTNPILEFPTLVALWRIYRKVRPQVVHHLTIKPVLYGGFVARARRIPVRINAVLGGGYLFSAPALKVRAIRTLLWPFFRFALGGPGAAVVVQNPEDRAQFARAFGDAADGRRGSRICLIRGSGVDPMDYEPSLNPEDPSTVLFAGRLLKSKGLADFVEAARLLKVKYPGTRFVVCGEIVVDNPAAIDEDTVKSWVAEGTIEWWGHRNDMPTVLGKAAIVTLPSWYGEGIPRILIEAAAAGRPIVTTDSAGCREIVRDGVNGLLVPPRNVSALSAAIDRLLTDSDARRQMGREGRLLVQREFTLEQVIRETIGLYDEMLAKVDRCGAAPG